MVSCDSDKNSNSRANNMCMELATPEGPANVWPDSNMSNCNNASGNLAIIGFMSKGGSHRLCTMETD
jgi:hypothetical protein